MRDRYAAIATNPRQGFNFAVGRAYAEALGYPAALLDALPATATEAFTGVASPVFRAELAPGETVVDLGCGAGLDLAIAARAVGSSGHAIGVDLARPMVARARRTVEDLGLKNVALSVARAEATGLPDAVADCVLINGLLNLSPDKDAVLREVARVLRPGGRLILAETTLTKPVPSDAVQSVEDWFR
ncbi:MAG TPA: methyltransferase domain-containing protein [Dehalococcoidia bacterium]|nr:methyltransferase domain-containing protein [Dehalococcoidia bacterium]